MFCQHRYQGRTFAPFTSGLVSHLLIFFFSLYSRLMPVPPQGNIGPLPLTPNSVLAVKHFDEKVSVSLDSGKPFVSSYFGS